MYEIRVLDLDAGRLMIEEGVVKAALRKLHISAHVTMVADNLAIARQGLMGSVPIIEVDGVIVCKGKPLILTEVMDLFRRLLAS